MTLKTIFTSSCIPILILTVLLASSCASKKDIIYFQDTLNFETILDKDKFVTKFKVDDEVSIFVSTLNPEASIPFNLFRRIGESGVGQASQVNYLVDQQGEIDFPVIGKIKIAGLSPEEVRTLLQDELADYLKDPIINIRLLNFTVTVLGEVNGPGTYQVVGEQVTILEALGLAGDLTILGMRNNILVIRDFNGVKVYNRINLLSKKAMDSPVYYLTQNDVVIVEPNSARVAQSKLDPRIGLTISIIGVVATISTILITRN